MAWTAGQILTAANLNTYIAQDSTDWAPATVSGLTKGNGTEVARYAQIGPTVFAFWQFTFGTTSAVTADIVLTLPVTATHTGSLHGWATLTDTGTAAYKGYVQGASTTTAHIRVPLVNASYPAATALSSTVPHTWANTDVIACSFTYLVG